MRNRYLIGLLLVLIAPVALSGVFNLHRGDLLDLDSIDIEWRKQTGNCPAKFPAESVDCSYFYANANGIMASHIDIFSQHADFNTENTYLLNVSINGIPASSCQLLQQKIAGLSLITINKTGCVIS